MSERTCAVEGCSLRYYAKGLCASHYQKQRIAALGVECGRDECTRPVYNAGRQLCRSHYDEVMGLAEVRAAWRRANAERIREQVARRYRGNVEANRAAYRARRASDPDRFNQRVRAWRAANPEAASEAVRQSRAKRRAREAAVRVGRVSYKSILVEHGMICHICGGLIESRADLHFDHVIPLAKGGPHVAENIRPAHALCNMRKGARLAS